MIKMIISFLMYSLYYKAKYKNRFKYNKFFRFSKNMVVTLMNNGRILLGYNTCFEKDSIIQVDGGKVTIGDRVYINVRCIISCKKSVVIGPNCLLGPDVKIYDNDHVFNRTNGVSPSEYNSSEIIIGENTWIGANVIILRGTIIGKNSVVAAGSIVKGSYPDGAIIKNPRATLMEIINEGSI